MFRKVGSKVFVFYIMLVAPIVWQQSAIYARPPSLAVIPMDSVLGRTPSSDQYNQDTNLGQLSRISIFSKDLSGCSFQSKRLPGLLSSLKRSVKNFLDNFVRDKCQDCDMLNLYVDAWWYKKTKFSQSQQTRRLNYMNQRIWSVSNDLFNQTVYPFLESVKQKKYSKILVCFYGDAAIKSNNDRQLSIKIMEFSSRRFETISDRLDGKQYNCTQFLGPLN